MVLTIAGLLREQTDDPPGQVVSIGRCSVVLGFVSPFFLTDGVSAASHHFKTVDIAAAHRTRMMIVFHTYGIGCSLYDVSVLHRSKL